jgi:thiamine-phosphate pyrophosphorylase
MSAAGRPGPPGLCFVTGSGAAGGSAAAAAAKAALAGGAGLVQVRARDLEGAALLALARELLAAAAALGPDRRVTVNDRLDVALAAKAHGVHLPSHGLPIAGVRRHVPRKFLVGRSVHAQAEAKQAEAEGASYLFFGPVFETPSKAPFGPPQGAAALRRVVDAVGIPVWAIGGVRADRLGDLRGIAIAGVAVISAIAEAPDPEAAARDLRAALDAAFGA